MDKQHLGICGLDCSKCDAYIATLTNDNRLRKKTAREWTEKYRKDGRNRPAIRPEEIDCRGCLSDGPLYHYCRECQIRKCAMSKKITNCNQCKDYKCDQLREFQKHLF